MLNRIPKLSCLFCSVFAIISAGCSPGDRDSLSKGADSENHDAVGHWVDSSSPDAFTLVNGRAKILVADLTYDDDAAPLVKISSAQVRNGYLPRYDAEMRSYRLELRGSSGKVLSQVLFDVPTRPAGPPPLPGDPQDIATPSTDTRFAMSLAWEKDGSELVLLSSDGKVLQTIAVSEETMPDEPVHSASALGSSFSAFADASGAQLSEHETLDIAFIGDGYQDLVHFANDADRFAANLLKYEPFASRAAQIVFHRVDYAGSLGCVYYGRLITCDDSKATRLVSGVPHDKVVIIVNNPNYGGSGGTSAAVAYNGAPGSSASGEQVFVHEFGHSFGNLMDEYVSGMDWGSGNCFRGTPPNAAWDALVAASDYHQGCTLSGYWRSSASSIMLFINVRYFNAVSIRQLNAALDRFKPRSALAEAPSQNLSRESR